MLWKWAKLQCGGTVPMQVRLFFPDCTTILRVHNGGPQFDPIKYYNEHIGSNPEKSTDIIGIKYVVGAAKAVYYRQIFGINNTVVIM